MDENYEIDFSRYPEPDDPQDVGEFTEQMEIEFQKIFGDDNG